MNDDFSVMTALALFTSELPDPERELYGITLDHFHFFPKLLIELPHDIWRCCFPRPRKISLNESDIATCFWSLDIEAELKKQAKTPLPITLQVNRESRYITKPYFCLRFHEDRTKPWQRRPLCVRPEVDSLSVDHEANPEFRCASVFNKMLSLMEAVNPKALSRLCSFELTSFMGF